MPAADRNLLYGVLAVQLGFVTRDQLIAATSRWVLDKDQPLGEVFIHQGYITRAESQTIDRVVEKQLERHGDPRQSLQSIEIFEDLRETLKNLDDTEIRQTVEFETVGSAVNDPYTTMAPQATEIAESKHRFTVLRPHQKGGLGCVSIALDEELNREIALKEILPTHADHEENRTRFIREAEITGALEHPGIVPVYSLGKFADGRPYYAMRFVRGINLQVAIEDFHNDPAAWSEKQLAFRQLLSKIIDVCQALEYAHSRGVIHRDIKPSNIMLGDYGETLLVDWGLAKTLGEDYQADESTVPRVKTTDRASSTQTQMGRIVGTPSFMSPEQAAGRLDSLSATSDIYSLGVTLHQLLTGESAFRGNEDEVLGNVQLGRFKKPREVNRKIPRPLEAICLKAMSRMPKERYQSAREMADDLERFLGDERVLAYREPLPAKAWRWIRNHKTWVLSSAAALTVAVTALSIGVVLLGAANVRERTERERAEKNYAEATEQRKLAERNFALARSAVHDYYVTVSEDTLLQQPGMQGLREDLMRQALVYYQRFLEERQDDPALQQEVANAHYYVGSIVQAINSPGEALPQYELAAKLQNELLTRNPNNVAIKSGYGQSLNAIGGVYYRLGKIETAREYFQQSAKVRQEVAEANPENTEAARVFASSVMNIGSMFLAQREFEQAVPLFERAQMIRMAHVDQLDKTEPKLQRDLGMGYYQIALVRRQLGDAEVAEANFLTAIESFSKLLEREPRQMDLQRNLAICLRGVADLKAAEDEPAEALDYYRRAEKIMEELTVRNPEVHSYAAELAGIHSNMARQFLKIGESGQGSAAAERAVTLLRNLTQLSATVPAYRMDLGIALRVLGQALMAKGNEPAARERLNESKAVLTQLLKEDPSNDRYATELGLTADILSQETPIPAPGEESPSGDQNQAPLSP